MAGWAGGNRHWTANHIINGDGDAATLKCYLMVTRTKEGAQINADKLEIQEVAGPIAR